jgi:hypothetical protein
MGKKIRHWLRIALAADLLTGAAFLFLFSLTPIAVAIASLDADEDVVSSSPAEPTPLVPLPEVQARRVISPDMETKPTLKGEDCLIGVRRLEPYARRVISPTP